MLIVAAAAAFAAAPVIVAVFVLLLSVSQSQPMACRSVGQLFCTRSTFALSKCFDTHFDCSLTLSRTQIHTSFRNRTHPLRRYRQQSNIESFDIRIHTHIHQRANDISCVYFHNFTCVIQKIQVKRLKTRKKYLICVFSFSLYLLVPACCTSKQR